MKKPLIALIVVFAAASWIVPAVGQDAPATAPELAGIQRSLDDLVDLLGSMRRNQDADLVLRRIELHERRLAPIARRLESNRQDQIGTESNITDAHEWMARTEDQIEMLERRSGADDLPSDLRQQLIIGQSEVDRLNRRLEGLRQRQVELEHNLADGRDEIEILDELLVELVN